uniref:Methanogenesis marker 6 protein n=1 Tax=Candidatus Methanomethylicus mesodigestus TaxID=1867258 RepID=A0A7C3J469_9CREN
MIKTYVVVLSSDSNLTPSMLTEKVTLMGGVEAKETCYGILVEGEEGRVKEVLEELRKLDPNRVFFKIRGYRIGDERICRAKRGGGPRPGYHMLSVEREALKNVARALDSPDSKPIERPLREKISAEKIKRIIEEGGSN